MYIMFDIYNATKIRALKIGSVYQGNTCRPCQNNKKFKSIITIYIIQVFT